MKKEKLLTWLIVGSVALNLYTISRLGKLRIQVENVNNNLSSNINLLHTGLDGVSGRIKQIQDEGKWISSIEFKPNQAESSPEEIHLNIEWGFREIERNAKIYLLYRAKGETQWSKITAVPKGGSLFSAPVVVVPEKTYDYQIVAEGDILRAGEISDIPESYYRFPPLRLISKGSSSSGGRIMSLNAEFSQRVPVLFDFYRVKEVRVRIQRKGQEDQLVPLNEITNTKDNQTQNAYSFSTKIDPDIVAIILEVEYKNGTTDRGEIYPNDVYMREHK